MGAVIKIISIIFLLSNGAKQFWNYAQSASNTQVAGRILGNFIREMKNRNPSMYVYLVGHSLGAHVCGQAGSWLKIISNNNYEIDRIDGLDPAGPLFLDDNSIKKTKTNESDSKSDDYDSYSEDSEGDNLEDNLNGFFKGVKQKFQLLLKQLQGKLKSV